MRSGHPMGLISDWLGRLKQTPSPSVARQIQLHLALLPVYGWLLVVWTAYAIDISPAGHLDRSGHIKGHDFVHDYVLGQIGLENASADLYDFDAQARRTDRLVPEYPDRFVPLHGPQMSVFFEPFARLPYVAAVTAWLAITAALYGLCCFALWAATPALRQYRWLTMVGCAGYPAFYLLIANGQIAVLALVLVTTGYFALRADRPWLAGLALGSLFYKPSLGLVLPVVLLYGREWKMIGGATFAVALQLGVAWLKYGTDALVRYFDVVIHLNNVAVLLEPQPFQMQSLRSFFALLLPWPGAALVLYVSAAAGVLVIACAVWRTTASLELRFSVFLLATVLVDPHVNAYDLVVIGPVFFLALGWVMARGRVRAAFWTTAYLAYFLPALQFVPRFTDVQVSVLALVALLVLLAREAEAGKSDK
jgi:hypothetical protein